MELGVVGKLESTTDGWEAVGSDIGQLSVAVECKWLANLLQLREGNRRKAVLDKGNRVIDRGELGEKNVTSLTDSNVGSPDELREGAVEWFPVELNRKSLANISQRRINNVQVTVVVNVKGLYGHQANTTKAGKDGIGNEDAGRLGDSFGEGQLAKSGKGSPRDRANFGQLRHRQARQDSQALHDEITLNLSEHRAINRGQSDGPLDGKISLNCLDARQRNSRNTDVDGNIPLDSAAITQGTSITIALDLDTFVTLS